MRTQPRSSRRISFFNNCLNSAWRLALIGSIVFGVAFVVGYTATAAAPVVLNGVVNSKRGDSQSTSERAATKGVLVRHTNRDLNQPLSASSLLGIFEAKVSTDKADYRPGETAIITGSGFWANEIVTLQVVHVDGGEEDGAGHEPWNVAADADGNFTSSWFVNPDDSLGATFVLTAVGNSSGLTAQTTFTDKPAANLDQCANGGVGDTPVQCAGAAWQNGNLNGNQAHYLEGQTVPYRAVFTDLTAGATYTTTIQYDTTQDGKHATDYLMTFNATEVTADPCTGSGVPSCAAPTTFPIPLDPNVSGAGVTQVPGQNFTMYNGSISIVSAYTLTGTYAGTSKTSITLTFSPTADGTAVIAWGGHISTRIDWGVGNSAIAIDGAPYHMRLIGFTCSNVANCSVGNQDRSLAAGAIFFPAILNITKVTVPSPQTTAKLFAYTATGTDVSNFSLDDDPNTATSNTKSFSLTDTSSRSITEGDPSPEFTFTDLMCNQVPDPQLNDTGTVNIDLGARSVTVTPAEGETINCTYVNTQGGKIIIKKETNPDGDPQSFTFTASYDVDGFSLKDGEQNDSGFLSVGNYSVSETVPSGWDMTSSCVSSKGDNESAGSISLQAGETVTCTFTNTKRGHIVVDKVTNPSGDSQSFNFDAGGGSYADFSLTDAAAPNDQELVPGNYSVSETVPAGWDLTSATCSDGSNPNSISLQAGETVTCTFTNTKRGTIIVEKQTNPDAASGSFTFTGTAAGIIGDGQTITVPNLVPGTYYSTENDPTPNFDLTSISCNDGSSARVSTGDVTTRKATFRLDPGETVKCTFTNTQRGMVEVLKITNGAANPNLDIKFTLYKDGPDLDPDLTGTDTELETLSTLGDADGLLQFTTKLVPDTKYTVCENPVPAGWTSLWMISFSVNGTIVTPYNPNGNDSPAQDLGIRCFDFTVTPGQTKSFEVHNDFPGGDPRTIGYWKNWNRCTGGGQAANADKNGGPAAGFFLVDNLLPQLIGDFNVTTCAQAVKILSKQDQAGKSKSSDAAYELAAQLLAAKLNLAAGAETCAAVQSAVVNGQALLDQINFSGSGDYLGSKAKGAQLTQRNQALSLANTLDQYNNGNLCP